MDLAISGVEMRWVDPVPQTGTDSPTTPADPLLGIMTFTRQDSTTIQVTLASGARSCDFDVVALPSEEERAPTRGLVVASEVTYSPPHGAS